MPSVLFSKSQKKNTKVHYKDSDEQLQRKDNVSSACLVESQCPGNSPLSSFPRRLTPRNIHTDFHTPVCRRLLCFGHSIGAMLAVLDGRRKSIAYARFPRGKINAAACQPGLLASIRTLRRPN